ncbi:SDR family oxidoreductase [Streptomyces olivaceus]|uniref:SDR family oxidoreductase n=1 Tax=Streptomyces TaxID=1883 RepID=UPI001CCEF3F2|nr:MULTISPECIES: SDR family oxidoreductase [Streptomyces]MBZ6134805.1 SDR family oxidoreductase [Streptomyces olivaceus]MBZ6141683.1 SDR family oxidoreductase [Streptomyces olivaceus]MBZ6169649.1 SDR family oxidoreductase [Streptomyces olivaceus]MBZ6253233.1 SDR family oxidoreductase [Streptomyces olivaceus]UOG81950.1 SDR family oxidoreductase [Streptomyces sp. CB09030]
MTAVELSGKVALVTGASRGIGYGVAEALVARGDRVCITGRNEDALKEAVEKLGADRVIGVAGKAHDEAHQAVAVERVMEAFGRVDFLVNNAGTNPVFGPIADMDLNVARKVFETNVLSALGFAQRTWHAWQKDNGGAIVNIASVAGLSPSPFIAAYGVSKAALINLTVQLAHEFAPAVRVNAIAPAVVKTKFAAALYEGREEEAASGYPLGRLGVPSDIGGAASFLTSEQSAWVTGQTLVVDGGVFLNAGVG